MNHRRTWRSLKIRWQRNHGKNVLNGAFRQRQALGKYKIHKYKPLWTLTCYSNCTCSETTFEVGLKIFLTSLGFILRILKTTHVMLKNLYIFTKNISFTPLWRVGVNLTKNYFSLPMVDLLETCSWTYWKLVRGHIGNRFVDLSETGRGPIGNWYLLWH